MTIITLNKFTLKEIVCSNLLPEIKFQNAAFFYQLSKLFKLQDFKKSMYSYIQCAFPMVVETQGFSELDYNSVLKLLGSSNLNIDSEVQILSAAYQWLCHNFKERRKFTKNILSKVRLFLLPDHTLKYLLNSYNSEDLVEILNKALIARGNLNQINSETTCTYRYCNQKMFRLTLFGGHNFDSNKIMKNVNQFRDNSLEKLDILPSMLRSRFEAKAVCVKGDIYFFGGAENVLTLKVVTSVDKYSLSTKTWNKVADMIDGRHAFCVCSFMDKIYLIGGADYVTHISSCFQFNTDGYKFNKVAEMNEKRSYAACTVYEEKVVVSGGKNRLFTNMLDTVECYDVVTNSWSPNWLPKTVKKRWRHNLVVIQGKLFAVGGEDHSCEVFDRTSKKFTAIKPYDHYKQRQGHFLSNSLAIGAEIFIFFNEAPFLLIYNIEKNKWSKKSCDATRNIWGYGSIKLPFY